MKKWTNRIRHEQIRIGDTIRVQYKLHDTVKSIEGTVAKREHTTYTTEWITRSGVILLTRFRNGNTEPPAAEIYLLDRRETGQAMFDLESLNA